jgi:hypothetical protein|tara:strand:+ start:257 stop:421 length:165 start_codon:yes stop_codon:yes gene_type:complete
MRNHDISLLDEAAAGNANTNDGKAIMKMLIIGRIDLNFNFLNILIPFVSFLLGH